jgi:hypothetical protein
MNPRRRFALFYGAVLVLMAPYLSFAMYCAHRFPSEQWPRWATNLIGIWFIANFIVLILLYKVIFRRQAQVVGRKTVRLVVAITRIFVSYLLIVWSVLFLYGIQYAIKTHLPLNRAVPAGAFLLFFIGLFGYSLYRDVRSRPS